MPDYSKGKIYTIRCKNDTSLIYVGSTIQPLAKRWGGHKLDSLRKQPEQLIYKTINNDWSNWYIELYELYPCNSKAELCKREGEVIREIGNLNYEIAGRTPKEYYEENKEKILEKVKEYRKINKEIISEKNKEKFTCNCGSTLRLSDKSQHLKTKKHINYLATIEG